MIVREARREKFTIVSNVALEDPRLSFQAKGLLVYLLSKPDGWSVSREHLATVGPNGISSVRAILTELEQCGYLTRTRKAGEHGHFAWESIIHEHCVPSAEKPPMVKPPMEKPPVVNRRLVNTDSVKTDIAKTEVDYSFVAQSAPPAEDAPAPVEKTKSTPAKRGTRLPDAWTPSPELIAWAKEKAPGVDILTATDNFVDYWRASSGSKASKLDWPAAWRVWIRNEGQRTPQRRAAVVTSAGGSYRTPAQQAAHERGMSTAAFFMDVEKELERAGALSPESRG